VNLEWDSKVPSRSFAALSHKQDLNFQPLLVFRGAKKASGQEAGGAEHKKAAEEKEKAAEAKNAAKMRKSRSKKANRSASSQHMSPDESPAPPVRTHAGGYPDDINTVRREVPKMSTDKLWEKYFKTKDAGTARRTNNAQSVERLILKGLAEIRYYNDEQDAADEELSSVLLDEM